MLEKASESSCPAIWRTRCRTTRSRSPCHGHTQGALVGARAVFTYLSISVVPIAQLSRTTSDALIGRMADTEMDVDPPATSTGKTVDKGDAKKRFEVKKVRALYLDP